LQLAAKARLYRNAIVSEEYASGEHRIAELTRV